MKNTIKLTLFISILYLTFSCKKEIVIQKITTNNSNLSYEGRLGKFDTSVALIESQSSVSVKIIKKIYEMYLKSGSNQHNYVSIEVDGNYIKRLRIENDSVRASKINLSSDKNKHIVTIYKATEKHIMEL